MSIWKSNLVNQYGIEIFHKLSLNEGDTPLEEKVISDTGIANFPTTILFKREDKNPTGSFKDRSIAYELSYLVTKHLKETVIKKPLMLAISSSGNSAISLCEYIQKHENKFKELGLVINLSVFVSEKTSSEKISLLKAYESQNDSVKIEIKLSLKPTSDCIKYCNEFKAFNLRSSEDDNAVIGYLSLGEEVAFLDFDSIFTTTSSGTSAIGIYLGYLMTKYPEYFKEITSDAFSLSNILSKIVYMPFEGIAKLNICQTTKVHPIAKEFDSDFQKTETSLVNCVVDRIAKRKEDLLLLDSLSKGSGFVISDSEIGEAKDILEKNGINIPINSICAFSGLIKSLKKGNIIKRPLIIVSGK